MTSCFTFLCFSEAYKGRRRRFGKKLHERRHFHPQSETAKVAREKNRPEESVESEDREGLDHDLEDEIWS